MDIHDFSNDLLRNLGFTPTKSQNKAIHEFAAFVRDPNPYTVFLLKGYAGTGKTSFIKTCFKTLQEQKIDCVLMASTGRAAKTISNIVGYRASTIHRLIYSAADYEEGQTTAYKIVPNKTINTLFVVDEASMIASDTGEMNLFGSGDLLEDLITYVYNGDNCRLMIIGDDAQLPPVGTTLSNALNSDLLYQRYGLSVYTETLYEVIRQGQDTGIKQNATVLRSIIQQYEMDNDSDVIPIKLDTEGWSDFRLTNGSMMIDELDNAYRTYGQENTLVLCYSNKLTMEYNLGIRQRIFDYDEVIVRGEKLIVARNNYHYTKRADRSDFIANGEIVEVRRIKKQYELYDMKFAEVELYLPDREEELDAMIFISTLLSDKPQLSREERTKLYNQISLDYEHIHSITERRRAIRRDKFWGALEVKYGYAITTHKAQGGEWPCVFIDLSIMSYIPCTISMLRWLYTAITRSSQVVYLVNAPQSILKIDNN